MPDLGERFQEGCISTHVRAPFVPWLARYEGRGEEMAFTLPSCPHFSRTPKMEPAGEAPYKPIRVQMVDYVHGQLWEDALSDETPGSHCLEVAKGKAAYKLHLCLPLPNHMIWNK